MKNRIINFRKSFHSGTLSFDGVLLTFVKVITMMVSIINTMILSRLLSLQEYGTYSQLLIVVSITTTISGMGLNNAVNYFYNKFDKEKGKYIGSIFLLTIIVGIFSAFLLIIGKDFFGNFYKNPFIIGLIIYIAFKPVLDNIVGLFQPLFISLKKAKNVAIINVIIAIMKVFLVSLAYIIFENIAYIFLAQIILDLIQIIILYLNIKTEFKEIKFILNKKIVKEVLKYTLPLTIALMSGVLFKELDKIIISKMATIEDTAIYSNMSKQLPFEFVATSFTAVVIPLMVKYLKDDKKSAIKLWKNFLEFSYVISWLLNIGAIICAKEILILLYSEKYLSGINIFIIYLIVEIFRFTYFGLILSASGKTKYITLSSVSSLVLNLVLNIVLYNLMGITGPAIATLITIIMMNCMQLLFSLKFLKVKLFDIFNMKNILCYLLQLILIGILCYGFKLLLYKFISNYIIILIIIYFVFIIINLFISRKKILILIKELK